MMKKKCNRLRGGERLLGGRLDTFFMNFLEVKYFILALYLKVLLYGQKE